MRALLSPGSERRGAAREASPAARRRPYYITQRAAEALSGGPLPPDAPKPVLVRGRQRIDGDALLDWMSRKAVARR